MIRILALSTGIYCIVNPQAASETLGLPVTTSVSPAIPFVSFVGALYLGLGLTALTLLYTGPRKALGMSFMWGVAVALTDARICFKYDAREGKAVGHAAMGVAAGLLGAGMY
jgi:hypothetical protein